jgi:hypothetical protein
MKKKRTGPMTAAELMKQLEADAEYQAFAAERDRRLREIEEAGRREEQELASDLRRVGVVVSSAWDLVNTRGPYPAAIPVLLDHLRRPYSEKTKEGIARALAVPEAKDGWNILLDEFEINPDIHPNGYKWAVGVALGVVARETGRHEEALRLLRDKRHGENRSALLEAIAFSKDKSVRPLIAEFADDPEIGEQVRWQLKHPGRRSR